MADVYDYLTWRGDILFSEREFNEVDNLILSCLVYLNMDDLLPEEEPIPLGELLARYERAGYDQSHLIINALPLLKKASAAERFQNVRVGDYKSILAPAEQIQFAAAAYYLEDGTVYAAFRGTDNTIVGWQEDFNFSYLSETPGQHEAVLYLDSLAAKCPGRLRVGGHSKGGNLAIYAAAFSADATRSRILTVYSNDGPGFNSAVTRTGEYQSILDKVELIVPESSLIGILLSNKEEKRIVKSAADGALQHNPYTWQILGTQFETVETLSSVSLFMDEALDRWVGAMDAKQREQLVGVIFDSMNAAGAATLHELNANKWSSYSAILRAVLKIDPARRMSILDALRKLAAAGSDVAQAETRKLFSSLLSDSKAQSI